jgi:sec-independent protein translocase protein TatB
MIDFGFDKLALIGGVALIVLGPEKLPRVARTVGHLLGRAQRYVAEVKAEVNRSIELEDLKKMKTEFEDAARNAGKTVSDEIHQTSSDLEKSWQDATSSISGSETAPEPWTPPPPQYKHPKKNWRLKRGSTPVWYKQRSGVKVKAQSGAARVARFRPRPSA